MRHRSGFCGTVPMALLARAPDHIARANFSSRATFTLCPADAIGDYQCLAKRMGVPDCTSAGFKSDNGAATACRFFGLEETVNTDCAGEKMRGTFGRGL